ncbi:hypothetical protein [Capnocytophaga sp. H2931]|uniref:hypothetical protein n=1 Tax=Capnocytophaga sp. H2931 TaxID=1945657 RepID=UPI000BB16C96|nr:hypothetical protein [Capnocytophaga sp. H2931]ATA75215.1 hypothetical protein CGC52_07200 [Capnocytophaga sp. H2931]
MATAREIIKQWFENFKKPTQEHFWAWIDSFWHKNEKIPMSSVQNLEQSLQNVVTSDQFNNHINDGNAHQALFDSKLDKGTYTGNAKDLESAINHKVDKVDGKGLSTNDFTNSDKQKLDDTADKVIVSGAVTGEVNKILTLTYSDGTALHISFQDLGIDNIADIMLNSLNFNFETGVLTGLRSDGQQLTVNLDGRYSLLDHHHDDLYAKKTHTHSEFALRTHQHNWDDIQNKPDLSQLGAKSVIKVTVDTARTISVKVGTTTAGNYVPKEGDELSVEFKKGQTANNVTLNIDNSGEKKIVIGGAIANSRTLLVTDHKLEYKKMVRLWYDGENYQLTGSTYNSTYEIIHTARLEDVQNQQPHLVSGKILAWVRNWANIIGKPDIETVLLKITNNTNTEDLINNVPQKGKTIVTQGTANIVVTVNSADGFVASYQKAGTGNITFQAGNGKTLVQVDGTNVINGVKGSTATVTVVGNEVLLRVSNV